MNEINFGTAIVLPPCCFKKLIGDEFTGMNWNAIWEKTKDPQPKTRMFYNRGDLTMGSLMDYAVRRTGWASVVMLAIPELEEDTVKEICGLMDMFAKERPLVIRLGIVTAMSDEDVKELFKKVGKDYGQRMSVKQVKGLAMSAIAVKNAKAAVTMTGEFVQHRSTGLYGMTISTQLSVYREITDYLGIALKWKGVGN